MAKACSICFIETTNLIPLFSKYNSTTLSKIVKSMKKTKIKIADRPTSAICLTCIEQCIRFFKNQQSNNYLSTSHQPKLGTESSNNSVGSSADKSINILDYDCLAKIFMLFPPVQRIKLENVCTKWKNAGALAWYDIKKIDYNALQINSLANRELILKKILLRCGCYLTHLSFEIFDAEHSELFYVIKNNCQNVTHLSLDMMIHQLDQFLWIKSLKKLQCLKVNGDVPQGPYENILSMIPKNIQEIHLSSNNQDYGVLNNTILTTLLKFHNLYRLTLHNVFIDSDLMELLSLKTKLVYLDLKGCYFWPNNKSMFSNLINLEHLDLRYIEHVGQYMFSDIVENCIKLKYLNLERIYELDTKNGVSQLGNLKQLEYLNLKNTSVDESMLFDIMKNLKNLTYLDINNCFELPKYIIDYLSKLKNLEHLNIENIKDLNTKSISAFADNFENLKTLKILLSGNISANALKKFANLKKLEHLEVNGITKKNEKALVTIGNECKNIKYLLLAVNARAVVAIPVELGNLRKLETLIIENFNEVPPEIFKKLHRLKHLDFMYCKNITDLVAAHVIDNCQMLAYLGCSESDISVNFLNYAVEKIKYRTNNNILVMHVDELTYEDFDGKENYFSGLRLCFR